MRQIKPVWLIYGILLAVLVFFLGYTTGKNQTIPQVVVSMETPVEKPPAAAAETPQGADENGIIDLNTADAALLDTLPGIGPELAARIVAYRETYGLFVDKSQIMDVHGIGESKYAQLEQRIKVGGNP